jgi:glycosyltransferase involved in cell wall biosynthesis
VKRLNVLRVVIGLNQGGVQQGVLNLFRGLDPTRFRPIACALENDGAVGREIAAAGFEVINLGHRGKGLGIKIVRDLVRVIREKEIAIVHGSSYHPSLFARVAGLLAGAPVLISHEHVVFRQRRLKRCVYSHLLGRATDAHIAVCCAVRDQVVSWYRLDSGRVRVIYNGVDTDRFHPAIPKQEAKRHLGLSADTFVAMTTCRLDPEKGHRFLFEAVAPMMRSRNLHVVVVGTGRGEEEVKAAAAATGIRRHVSFLGLRRDIPELLAASDVYVSPTLQEGFPNSVLEAMAMACPVIVTDVDGNTEAVTHNQDGLVVPRADPMRLRGALERLMHDPALRERLGSGARRTVLQRFTVDRFVTSVESLYEEILDKKGVRSALA